MGSIELRTERLSLRPFRARDAEALMGVFGDSEVMRFGDGVKDRAWVEAWIERQIESDAGAPDRGLWAVVLQASDVVLGYCGLFAFDDLGGQAETEVGYRLAQAYWGKGYATEAALAVRNHALGALGCPRLVSLIDPGNAASIRVAQKLGMRFEKEVMLEGYDHPDHLYVIEAADVRPPTA